MKIFIVADECIDGVFVVEDAGGPVVSIPISSTLGEWWKNDLSGKRRSGCVVSGSVCGVLFVTFVVNSFVVFVNSFF